MTNPTKPRPAEPRVHIANRSNFFLLSSIYSASFSFFCFLRLPALRFVFPWNTEKSMHISAGAGAIVNENGTNSRLGRTWKKSKKSSRRPPNVGALPRSRWGSSMCIGRASFLGLDSERESVGASASWRELWTRFPIWSRFVCTLPSLRAFPVFLIRRLGRYNNFPRLLALGGETCSNALEACTVVSGLLGSTARYRGWRGTGRTNGKTNRLHVRLLCDAPVVHNLIIPGRAVDILLFLGYNEWNSLTKR